MSTQVPVLSRKTVIGIVYEPLNMFFMSGCLCKYGYPLASDPQRIVYVRRILKPEEVDLLGVDPPLWYVTTYEVFDHLVDKQIDSRCLKCVAKHIGDQIRGQLERSLGLV